MYAPYKYNGISNVTMYTDDDIDTDYDANDHQNAAQMHKLSLPLAKSAKKAISIHSGKMCVRYSAV